MASHRVRTRRLHSEAFKTQVVAACRAPGASVAGVALAQGLNANLVRRWMRERGIELPGRRCATPAVVEKQAITAPAFMPIRIAPPLGSAQTIQVEVRRGNTTIKIAWPVETAAECAAWLRAWLT